MLTPRSLVTLADAKAELKIPSGDTNHDSDVEGLIDRSSGLLEGFCGRPLAYYPSDQVAAFDVTWANGAVVLSYRPSAPSTLYVVTPSSGTLVLTGTGAQDETISETFGDDGVGAYHGIRTFKTITGAVVAGVTNQGGPPTVNVAACAIYSESHISGERRGYLYVARPPILYLAAVLDGYVKVPVPLSQIQWDAKSGRVVKYGYNQARTVAAYQPLTVAPFVDFPEDAAFRLGAYAFTTQVVLQYVGGFRCTPGRSFVPGEVRDSCLRVLAQIYRERDKKEQGVSSASGTSGSRARFQRHPMEDQTLQMLMRPWMNVSTTARL